MVPFNIKQNHFIQDYLEHVTFNSVTLKWTEYLATKHCSHLGACAGKTHTTYLP